MPNPKVCDLYVASAIGSSTRWDVNKITKEQGPAVLLNLTVASGTLLTGANLIAVSLRNGDIYAGTDTGVYRSAGGQGPYTFSTLNPAPANTAQPTSKTTGLALCASTNMLWQGTSHLANIYFNLGGGAAGWRTVFDSNYLSAVTSIACAANGDIFFSDSSLGLFHLPFSAFNNQGQGSYPTGAAVKVSNRTGATRVAYAEGGILYATFTSIVGVVRIDLAAGTNATLGWPKFRPDYLAVNPNDGALYLTSPSAYSASGITSMNISRIEMPGTPFNSSNLIPGTSRNLSALMLGSIAVACPYASPSVSPSVSPTRSLPATRTTSASVTPSPSYTPPPRRCDLYVADAASTTISVILGGTSESVPVATLDRLPNGIAVGMYGDLYITSAVNNALLKIPAGSSSATVLVEGGDAFSAPQGLAVAIDGSVYIADAGSSNSIKKYANATIKTIDTFRAYKGQTPKQLFPQTMGVAINVQDKSTRTTLYGGPYNNIYFTANSSNNIFMMQESGNGAAYDGQTINKGWDWNPPAHGIALDYAGNVYATTGARGGVLALLAANSKDLYTFGYIGSGFSSAYGIAVDEQGVVYVADTLSGLVKKISGYRFNSDGAYLGSTVSIGSGFQSPYGLAMWCHPI